MNDGLLNYQPDPIAQGLIAFGGGLLTPRGQGGGLHAGLLGGNQAMMQAAQQRQQMQMQMIQMQRQKELDELNKRKIESELALGPDHSRLYRAQADKAGMENDAIKTKLDRQKSISDAFQRLQNPLPSGPSADQPGANLSPQGSPGLTRGSQLMPSLAESTQPQGQMGARRQESARMNQLAGLHEQAGDIEAADKIRQNAAKLMPEIQSRQQTTNPQGKIVMRQYYKDGTFEDLNDTAEFDPNKAFNVTGGKMSANNPLQAYELNKSKAGATKLTVVNEADKSMAKQIGPMMEKSAAAVSGSVNLANAADRIIGTLDKGDGYFGPTASLRLKGAQFADLLGVAGKDTAEKITNTRQVIRAFAESSIEARKELQGQGQVTENEAKAVDKAISGNIDDLTVPEMRDLANLNKKRAAMQAFQHRERLKKTPSELQPFYTVPGLDGLADQHNAQPKLPTESPSIDSLVNKYRKR